MRRALAALAMLAAMALPAALAPWPARAEVVPEVYEQVWLTPAQALAVALPGAERVVPRVYTPTPEARQRVERRLGRKVEEASWTFHEGLRGAHTTGWALIVEEKGKYHPITFVVGLTPQGAVGEVAVMVYRERRGEAVRRRRFLGQFQGKTAADPLMVNRDIVHLTGATVSSWSIAAGVKKATVVFEEVVRPQTGGRK